MSSPSKSPPHSVTKNVPKRKSKSVVLMKELTALRDQGIKLTVDFDDDGEPIGNIGSKYTSYVGVMARTKVPIDIRTWKDVEDELKLKIWDDVLTIFDIPASKKKQVITIANSTWTNFKSKLTSLYVYKKPPAKGKLPAENDPVKKYPYITAEVWKRFKETRMTPEFQAISKIAAERLKKNKYPHRMSRGGYRKTRQKLEEKLKKKEKSKENVLDVEESSQSTTTIKRGDLWIEGRVDKDGECLNSETKKKIEDINAVKEMVKKREFEPTGKLDILTKALGTDEHYGRVRGVGGRVGHKQYFGKCKIRRVNNGIMSKEFVERLTQEITQKVRAEISKETVEQRAKSVLQIEGNNGNVSYSVEKDAEVEMNLRSGNASYDNDLHDPDPFDDIPDKGVECDLSVLDPEVKKVALGRVFKAPTQASTSHGRAFGANELRVCIDVVLESKENTPLPLPTEEFLTVGEAIGSFVRWPRNLISLRCLEEHQINHELGTDEKSVTKTKCRKRKTSESNNSRKVESGRSKTNESMVRSNTALKSLLDRKCNSRRYLSKVVSMMGANQVADVIVSEKVVGYNQRLRLAKEDIVQLLNMEKLCLSCIQLFVGYLSSICDIKTYGFLCPQKTSVLGHNSVDDTITYISDWMKEEKKQIYIAPYYAKEHWMLAVIDIVDHNQVYWFDSMGNYVPTDLRTLINTATRIYGYNGGARMGSKTPQWVKLNCPRQPGVIECGYYIMRYMLEIVTRSKSATINELFKDTMAYSQEEIDEVRDLWADYFRNA